MGFPAQWRYCVADHEARDARQHAPGHQAVSDMHIRIAVRHKNSRIFKEFIKHHPLFEAKFRRVRVLTPAFASTTGSAAS